MDARDLLLIQHTGVHACDVTGSSSPTLADRTFSTMSEAQLRLRPGPNMNSVAWLMWHIARTEDVFVNVIIAAQPQVFDDPWRKRLRVDRRDIGTSMTSDEVAALSDGVDVQAVRDYRRAVGQRTREFIGAMPASAWEGKIEPSDMQRAAGAGAFAPAAAGLVQYFAGWSRAGLLAALAVAHNATHIGEAQTVRSLGGFGLDH
jgi:hypothetical protein